MSSGEDPSHAGDLIETTNAAWSFGGAVPDKFEEHVARSVPLYKEGHELVVSLSDFFLSDNSLCYEVGSSTGILIHEIVQHNASKNIRAIGIDTETDMISYSQAKYGMDNITFLHADIDDVDMESSDMIIAYYTMQFIKPRIRQDIFNKIYQSLNWGGAFIMFEKVRAPDARFQDIMTSMYNDYKISKGYSCDEIMSKSRSLKGVLEPFSSKGNIDMMERAGFEDITSIMKYICFEGYLCIK